MPPVPKAQQQITAKLTHASQSKLLRNYSSEASRMHRLSEERIISLRFELSLISYLVNENSDEIPSHRQSLFKLHRDRI